MNACVLAPLTRLIVIRTQSSEWVGLACVYPYVRAYMRKCVTRGLGSRILYITRDVRRMLPGYCDVCEQVSQSIRMMYVQIVGYDIVSYQMNMYTRARGLLGLEVRTHVRPQHRVERGCFCQ
jgi:hypothetical protein